MERTTSKVPKFFTEIEPGFSTGDLRIPPKISRRMLYEFSETVTLELKDYPKCLWTVQVSQIEGDVYLKDGWQKFIKDNSLGVILVLRYERAMHFTIEVFPKTAIVSDPSQEKSTRADNTKRTRLTPRNCNHQAAGENIPNCQSTQLKEVKEKEVEEQTATLPNTEFPSFSVHIRRTFYRVRVPKDFSSKHLLPQGDYNIVLKNSKGKKWIVKVIRDFSSVSFSKGWAEFRRANQINLGDLCTFKLLDKKTFAVHVRTKRCTKKHQLETMAPRTIDNDVEEKEPITFCTLFSPGISNEILEIPQKFQMHILNELSKLGEVGELALLKIKDYSNCAWNIRVHQNATAVFLKEGWREFLEDHCIGDGELLIVRYDGRMQFSIQIFDKNRVERVDFSDTETLGANQNFAHSSELNGGEEDDQHYRAPKSSKYIKSKIPTVAITISDNMYQGFPTEWCRKYLPANYYKFELKNADDIEAGKWKVKGGPNSEISLCKGWIAFLQGNRVKKGDVCLLELKSKRKMVVHIIRK